MTKPEWPEFRFPPINLWSAPPRWSMPPFKTYWYAKYWSVR